MNHNRGQNAVNALLSEFEKTIAELQNTIKDVSSADLIKVVDNETQNPDCKSIQTVLSHIISSGYSYCIYIQNFRNINSTRPDKVNLSSIAEYNNELHKVIEFNQSTFASIYDHELEEYDNAKKIMTRWGQLYDIEQLMEHAIVHVLRHRRQIEKFKIMLLQ